MSKRRINKQQATRIQKIQDDYRQNADGLTYEGTVLARFSRHADIEDDNGRVVHCSIRPNIDSLVAGDRVIWQLEGTDQGVVLSRYPRQSSLVRPDKQGNFRPVAANLTQMMIVVACKPEISWSLLDSYLIIAEHLALQACIVLNKTDISCESLREELISTYQPLGYSLCFASKYDNQSYESLKQVLNNHISVFVGQSGVGKSSLIAAILPHENNIQIADISTSSELGRHTTSNSRFYHLPSGGALIDSPGVREFGLWHMPLAEIVAGYREFNSRTSGCKFRNCNHLDTPGCAILAALDEGNLSPRRYDSFVKISSQFKNN